MDNKQVPLTTGELIHRLSKYHQNTRIVIRAFDEYDYTDANMFEEKIYFQDDKGDGINKDSYNAIPKKERRKYKVQKVILID